MTSSSGKAADKQKRSMARLAAAQALYVVEQSGASPDNVLNDILQHGLTGMTYLPHPDNEDSEVEAALAEPDAALLIAIVRGVIARTDDFDAMINAALSRDWTVGRLELILRAILRAGACELANSSAVPARVVITEYVDVAHAFYAGSEVKMVNAVLDKIARLARPDEFTGNGR